MAAGPVVRCIGLEGQDAGEEMKEKDPEGVQIALWESRTVASKSLWGCVGKLGFDQLSGERSTGQRKPGGVL